jgi:signal transduction histidine kinase/ligand-binding sensor domain-containing protein
VERRTTIAFGILLACSPFASALNPSLDIHQYAHNAWKIREGFSRGTILAITQTQDGYLWLGTEFGLLRFDGVRLVPWKPPTGQQLPDPYIRSLLAARDGTLWIGTSEGLASWMGGKLTVYPALAGQSVWTLLQDHEGTVWAGGHAAPYGKLCQFHGGDIQCHGHDGSFGQYVDSLYEDRRGNLWVASIRGLWRWKPGPPAMYPIPDRVHTLIEDDNGVLLIDMFSGIMQFTKGKLEAYPLPAAGRRFAPNSMLRDRDGGLWIGTADRGLLHVHQGRTDVFERSDGLSSDFIEMLFEDREGDVWVPTLDGLDRFRDLAVPTISVKQGLSNATVASVLAARDGSVWLGTADGLDRWNNGRITVYRKKSVKAIAGSAKGEEEVPGQADVSEITGSGLPGDAIQALFQDSRDQIWAATANGIAYLENRRFIPVTSIAGVVFSISGDQAGNIWVSQRENIFHLRGGRVVERFSFAGMGHPEGVRCLVADPVGGGLWLAFREGGLAYFKDGRIRASYAAADGLGAGHIRDLQLDPNGTLWASTDGGLSRVKDGRAATITTENGLPCDAVHWVAEDDDHSVWMYLACGLARTTRTELDAWAMTANKHSKRQIQFTVFGGSDGVRSHTTSTGYSPSVAKSSDGKIWFLPWDGVSVIDPRHLPFNKIPPPVHIEEITADRKSYWQNSIGEGSSSVRLPSLIRDLEIDYTALSLVAPEAIRFRIKLEGRDPGWKDIGDERKVFYTDLPPRNYRFRVMACNNSGVWNEAGASLDFSIDPAYYQTIWFRGSCVAAFFALLWALYRYRLHQMALEFNARLDERVSERTRIARELHDTLLQSFHGVLFRFQAARNLLPRRSDEAIPVLDGAISRAQQAILEGRNAIQDLRSQPSVDSDLEHLLTAICKELEGSHDSSRVSPSFSVTVEGKRQDLSPILQDEVYRIVRELLRNAFQHADASHIEAEIRYDHAELRVRIRDDGKGIQPKLLEEGGRAGHWGLPGIRERAKRIGAQLELWSESGAGTEAELIVPASVGYGTSRSRAGFRLFRKTRANA